MSPFEICFGSFCCMLLPMCFSQKTRRLITLISYLCPWIGFTHWPSDKAISQSVTSLHVCDVRSLTTRFCEYLGLMARTSPSPWASCHFFSLSLDNASGLYFSAVFIPYESNIWNKTAFWKLISLSGSLAITWHILSKALPLFYTSGLMYKISYFQ